MTSEEIAKKIKNQNNEAILLLQSGQYEQAYIAFAAYLKTLLSFNFLDHAAKARVNMANTLYLMGRYKESLECLHTSMKHFESKKDIKSLSENQITEGNLYIKLQDFDKLEALSKQMLTTAKTDKHKAIASIFKIYAIKDKEKITLDLINKAVTFAERSKDKETLKQALSLRVDYFKKNKRSFYATIDRDRIASL